MASFTAIDATHGNRSIDARELLQRLCLAANLCPQIMSHTVVEIHAANPRVDYRFNREFADHAIRVVLNWHDSGRGCINSTCYGTYPKGKVCNATTPPTVYMTGDVQTLHACQPQCFVRQRLNMLLKTASSVAETSLVTDNTDPRKCVECSHYTPLLTDTIVRRRLDNTYDLWDARSRTKLPAKPLPAGFHLQEAKTDEYGMPELDTDMTLVNWNRQERRCERSGADLLRQISEPYWRDASHSKCRLTNFVRGESVVPGYFSRDGQNMSEAAKQKNIEGFLQKNTATYCRAFGREWDAETGDCTYAWWETALTYTILGEGVFRLVRNLTETNSGCMDDYFKPTDDELGGAGKEADPFSARSYREWRGDVNTAFLLPPPNVTMLDLGIDVLVTGNRLYWNNYEGVLSHLAMFRTVEMVTLGGGGVSSRGGSDWRDLYANYNDSGRGKDASGMFGSLGKDNSSFAYQPAVSSVVTEKVLELMSAMDDASSNSGILGGSGKYTEDDVKRIIDEINELAGRNRIAEIFKEIGIQIGADIARHIVVTAIKRSVKRLLQHLTRNLAGKVAGSLMRTGLRIGLSRVIGISISHLTTKLIIAGTAASTGIGIVISIVEILSIIVDLALLFGWDPGSYNNYTTSAAFRPLMDGFMYAIFKENALTLTPDLIASQLVNPTTDSVDADKTSSGGSGTADAQASTSSETAPDYADTDTVDRRVNVPRWYNNRWENCFATDRDSLAHVRTRNVGLLENGGGGSTAPASVTTPAASGRTRLTSPRLALENNGDLWLQLYTFAYFGSLQTNSNGQLVRLESQTSEFDDERLADLVQEADYRDLTTISSGRDIDNRSYNKRVTRYRLWGGLALAASSVTAIAVALVTAKETSRASSFFFWGMSFVALLSLMMVLVCSAGLHVFDERYLASTRVLADSGTGGTNGTRFNMNSNGVVVDRFAVSPTTTDGTETAANTTTGIDPDKPDTNLLRYIDPATRDLSISRIIEKINPFQIADTD